MWRCRSQEERLLGVHLAHPAPPASAASLQAVHIAELEEENLNLRERVYLLEQQVAEMLKERSGRQGAVGGSSDSVASDSDYGDQGEHAADEVEADEADEGAAL